MANNKQDKILNVPNKREQRQTCLNVAERQALRPKGSVPNKREQRNVPALRFPEFKGQWENCRIKDFGKVVTGNTPPTANKENYENGTKLWVSPSDLGDKKYIDNTKIKLSIKGYTQTRILPKDSILVTCIGTIGKMGMAQTELATNQQINSIIVNHDFDKDFVYYSLMSRFPKYLSFIAIQVVPILSKSSFEKLENNYPSIEEQRKIGKFLDLIDARIATQRKIIEKLESLIHGVVTTHFHRTRNKNTITIKDLGKAYSVGNLSKEDLAEDGEPCILYGELFTTYGCVANKIQSRTNKYTQATLSRAGDLLFPASTTVDAISLIAPTSLKTEGVYVAGDMFGIRIKSQYNSEYISYIINYVYNRKLSKYAQGSTIIHLHYADIKNVTIQVPCLEEQNKCADLLSCLQMKLDTERQLCVYFQKQKDYLLQQMFI